MRRLLAFLAFLICGAAHAAVAPVVFDSRTFVSGTTVCFPVISPSLQLTIDATGAAFKCHAGTAKWRSHDLADCPANPPTGAAPLGNPVCRDSTGTLYGRNGSGDWFSLTGSGATVAGVTGNIQANDSGALGVIPGFDGDDVTGEVTTKILNGVLQAKAFATSGTGTEADPFVTSGSNAVQAAIAACPTTGCEIDLGDYVYTLGAADPAVTIPITTSSTDKRFYKIRGHGAVLNYSGTGTAIRYWQNHTGTPGSSIQSNKGNELSGFALRQTGTPRTGTGIWLNYVTLWTIRDLEIGTRKGERAAGDFGFSYGLRFAERSGGYMTVDDFNTVENCRFSGNTHALYAGQQADNLRLLKNYFEANPNVAAAQDGVEINNSNAITILGNTFNLFNFNTAMFGLKLSGDISGAQIQGNYLEGNAKGVYLNATANQDGVEITGNLFSFNSITGNPGAQVFGVEAGISATFKVRGLHIAANQFTSIGDSEYGVKLATDVGGHCVLGPNYYTLSGTTLDFNNVILAGAQCVVLGEGTPASSTIVETPQIRLMQASAGLPGIIVENTSSSAGDSPLLQLVSGGASHLYMNAVVDTAGMLHFKSAAGDTCTISAAGTITCAAMLPTTRFAGPRSTTLPATCTVGDEYFDTDATAGQNKYGCTATNVWTLQGDGGGSFLVNGTGVSGPNLVTSSKIAVSNPSAGTINFAPVTGSFVGSDLNASAGILQTQLASFSSADIRGRANDETGLGVMVFSASPVISAPTITGLTPSRCLHTNVVGEVEVASGDCAAGGGGSVTSVGLASPSEFVVSNTPVTGSGTLTLTKAVQAANRLWAGPTSGADAQPTFRAFHVSDCLTAPFAGTAGTSGCVPPPNAGDISSGFFLKANGTWAAAGGLATTGTPAVTQIARFGAGGTTLNGLATATLDDSGNMNVTSLTTATPANGSRRAKFVGNTTDPVAPANTDSYLYAKSAVLTDGLQLPFWRNATTGVIKILNDVGGDYGEFTCTAGACGLDDNVVVGADIGIGTAAGDLMQYNGTDWVRLAIGTAGQQLVVNGGATAAIWGAAGAVNNNVTFTMNGIATGDTGIVHVPAASTVTRIACYTVGGGTSVATVNVNKRAQATPATSGTDVTTTAYTCDTTTVNTAQTINSAAITAGDWLALTFGTVTGTANLVVSVDYTTP